MQCLSEFNPGPQNKSHSLTCWKVINNATLKEPYDASKMNQGRKPALGPTFTFMTDTTLWLSQKAPENDEEAAEKTNHLRILKSRTKVFSHSRKLSPSFTVTIRPRALICRIA